MNSLLNYDFQRKNTVSYIPRGKYISDSYLKIFEFTNVSSLIWTTHHRKVIIQIEVTEDNIQPGCKLEVVAQPQALDPHPYTPQIFSKTFRMRELLPIVLTHQKAPSEKFGYLISLVTASWNQASVNCSQMGGQLLAIRDEVTWKILIENMHYKVNNHSHFDFWKSNIVFISQMVVSIYLN